MNQNKIKKEVLDYSASATAVVNTEILQWCGRVGITDWYKELFTDTQIAQSVLVEFCQNPHGLKKPDFIGVFQDIWASYPSGYTLEPDGTLIIKLSTGQETALWYSSAVPFYNFTSFGKELMRVVNIGNLASLNFSDTKIKLSKGLHIYNMATDLYRNAASGTMQDSGDCGTFELLSKLVMVDQPTVALTADHKLRKDLEKNQYLYTGLEGILELSVAKGLTSEFDADEIHRIIRNTNNDARLWVVDWYKWHKERAFTQFWLRLYKRIKKE